MTFWKYLHIWKIIYGFILCGVEYHKETLRCLFDAEAWGFPRRGMNLVVMLSQDWELGWLLCHPILHLVTDGVKRWMCLKWYTAIDKILPDCNLWQFYCFHCYTSRHIMLNNALFFRLPLWFSATVQNFHQLLFHLSEEADVRSTIYLRMNCKRPRRTLLSACRLRVNLCHVLMDNSAIRFAGRDCTYNFLISFFSFIGIVI